jgi:hypothetical protein
MRTPCESSKLALIKLTHIPLDLLSFVCVLFAFSFAMHIHMDNIYARRSALTLNIAGVFKDLGLIGWSVVISGAIVTKLQYVGYLIALVGVSGYSAYKRAQQQTAASSKVSTQELDPPVRETDVRRGEQGAAAEESIPLGAASTTAEEGDSKC